MKGQSIFGIGFGLLMIIILLPFFFAEQEALQQRHIHTVEPVPLTGFKQGTVVFCWQDSLIVRSDGVKYYSERVPYILEQYE